MVGRSLTADAHILAGLAARLNREVQRAMKEPVVLDRFKALAVNLAEPMTPDQFATYVRAQYARYAKLLPELNIGQ